MLVACRWLLSWVLSCLLLLLLMLLLRRLLLLLPLLLSQLSLGVTEDTVSTAGKPVGVGGMLTALLAVVRVSAASLIDLPLVADGALPPQELRRHGE